MPKPTLYFLRSSEQKITSDMIAYAMRLDTLNKTIQDFPTLDIYTKHYGLSTKDLGLYALYNQTLAGAVWIRLLKEEDKASAYVDSKTPILNIALKPEYRNMGIGSAMLEQFLLEAGAVYEQISVSVLKESPAVSFYEKFGFEKLMASDAKSFLDGSEVFTMLKKLEKKEVQRPTDGYDAQRWME
jgi:ribosomal protein S18 acetylase RimI-like enzyme